MSKIEENIKEPKITSKKSSLAEELYEEIKNIRDTKDRANRLDYLFGKETTRKAFWAELDIPQATADFKSIGALWAKTSKDGKKYMSGILEDLSGDIRIVIFKNDRKEKENYPDYLIYRSEEYQAKPKVELPEVNPEEEVNLADLPF